MFAEGKLGDDLNWTKTLQILTRFLRTNERAVPQMPNDATAICLIGDGPGAIAIPPDSVFVCVNLSSRLQLLGSQSKFDLGSRSGLILKCEEQKLAAATAPGSWGALVFRECFLHLGERLGFDAPFLFATPHKLRLTLPVLRLAVSMVGSNASCEADWSPLDVAQLFSALSTWQAPLVQLASCCPGRTRLSKLQSLQRLLRARSLVECEGTGCTSVKEMAGAAHYSVCYFVRIFEDVFGESPLEFCRKVRMQRAMRLLASSDKSIAEIAERVGYSSAAAFSRAFRASFHECASKLRRESNFQAPLFSFRGS